MLRENIRPTEAEQEAWYETLAKVSSESLAFFISFDLPFELEAIPRDDPSSPWLAYLDNLHIKKLDVGKDGEAYGFLDGLTDITKIFGNLKKGEFSKAVDAEVAARTNKEPGTKARRTTTGWMSCFRRTPPVLYLRVATTHSRNTFFGCVAG